VVVPTTELRETGAWHKHLYNTRRPAFARFGVACRAPWLRRKAFEKFGFRLVPPYGPALMRYGLTLLFIFVGAVLLQAAPPSDQSLNEMMSLMQLEALLNQALKQMDEGMTKGMEEGLQKSLNGQELNAAQKAKVDEFHKKFSGTIKGELSFAKVKDIYLQAYRDTFTQDEVSAIIAFYKSPAGKAIIEKNPGAMQKANGLMQARISPLTLKLQSMLEDFVKDLANTK